jgi:hypothetical protein
VLDKSATTRSPVSCCAMMPEPITAATRSAVPSASATMRRGYLTTRTSRPS